MVINLYFKIYYILSITFYPLHFIHYILAYFLPTVSHNPKQTIDPATYPCPRPACPLKCLPIKGIITHANKA